MPQGPVSHEVTVESPEQSVPAPGSHTSQEDATQDPHAVPGAQQSQSTYACLDDAAGLVSISYR